MEEMTLAERIVQSSETLLLIFGGAAGANVVNYVLGKRKSKQDGFTILQNAWMQQYETMQKAMTEAKEAEARCEQRYADIRAEMAILRKSIKTMKSNLPDLPIPLWFKDYQGIMLSLNDAYENAFLIPRGMTREDYIGKTDDEVWGVEVAELFRKNDAKALQSREHVVFETTETIQDKGLAKLLEHWEFLKYPKYLEGIPIGIAGFAVPKKRKP